MEDKEILEQVAEVLRIERLKKHLSQEKLAEMADISTKYLNMIEKKKSNPTIIVVIKICEVLGMPLSNIYPIEKH